MKRQIACAVMVLALGSVGASLADTILPPASVRLAADFDGDGRVTLNDFFMMVGSFGLKAGEAGYDGRYDLDGDGTIGVSDFFYFSDSFGKVAPLPSARPPISLIDMLKKVSGPRFAKVGVENHGGPDENGASNVILIPQNIEEKKDRTPAGMEVPMVKVPAGDFVMGSNARELGLREDFPADESPVHLVYLNTFWIDKYEVTNEQFTEFAKATGHPLGIYQGEVGFNGPRQPVIGVNWNDGMDYCRWRGMMLPSEAQWEKAARGVDGRKYPWGNEFPDEDANGLVVNFNNLTDATGIQRLRANFNSRYSETFDVGSFPRGVSPYGVCDMAGNVWEWCMDYYDRDYYKFSPRENPRGPMTGTTRVVRGGSGHGDYDDVRTPYRGDMKPTEQNEFVKDYVDAFNDVRMSEDASGSVAFQYRYFIGIRCAKEGL